MIWLLLFVSCGCAYGLGWAHGCTRGNWRKYYAAGLLFAQRIAENEAWRYGEAMGPEQNCLRVANSIRKSRMEWEGTPDAKR